MENIREYLCAEITNYIKAQEPSCRNKLEKILYSEDAMILFEFILHLMNNSAEGSGAMSNKLVQIAETYSIESLGLSPRAYRALTNTNSSRKIVTIADLLMKTDHELLQYRNIGKKTVCEIKQKRDRFIQAWKDGELASCFVRFK